MAEEKKQSQKVKALATSQNAVPKYCTSINFGVMDHSQQVVISFSYKDPDQDTPILIERVVIDFAHAEKLSNVLTDLIKTVKEKNDNTR